MKGYTRLQWACSSTYDPRGFKVRAIRSLIYRGVNVRACCEAFGNSTLHLALLSARDEVWVNNEKWKCNSQDLRLILRDLVACHADITRRNHAGLTPSDVAIGLKCAKSWNNAMRDCGLSSYIIDASCSIDGFGQDSLSNNYSKSGGRTATILTAGRAGLTFVLSKAHAFGGTRGCHTCDGISYLLNGRSYEFHILRRFSKAFAQFLPGSLIFLSGRGGCCVILKASKGMNLIRQSCPK